MDRNRVRSQVEHLEAIQRQVQEVEVVLDLFKHEGWTLLVKVVESDLQSLEATLHSLTTSSTAREQAAVAVEIHRKLLGMPQFFEMKLKALQNSLAKAMAKPDRSWMERILTFIR